MAEQGVSWKTFYTIEAGRTNGARYHFIEKFKKIRQTELNSPEECDYLLVFCPVVSRVGTDIGEALDNIPAGKPVILVVMHHTFDPDHVVAESWKQVNNPNVCLTVDCLFYEGKFLKCNRNDIMWGDIKKFFGVPFSQGSVNSLLPLNLPKGLPQFPLNNTRCNWRCILLFMIPVLTGAIVLALLLYYFLRNKE